MCCLGAVLLVVYINVYYLGVVLVWCVNVFSWDSIISRIYKCILSWDSISMVYKCVILGQYY